MIYMIHYKWQDYATLLNKLTCIKTIKVIIIIRKIKAKAIEKKGKTTRVPHLAQVNNIYKGVVFLFFFTYVVSF